MIFYDNHSSDKEKAFDFRLFLGALLHDIGKFYMRTNNKDAKKIIEKEYETFFKEEGAFAPRHQEWGAFFAESTIPKDFQITSLIRNHHKPSEYEELLISIADRISAATDRESYDEAEEESQKVKQMISIFSNIKLERQEDEQKSNPDIYYKLLSKKYDIEFSKNSSQDDSSEDYQRLWQEFFSKMNQLRRNFKDSIDIEDYATAVYNLMQQYTYNIPSAFYHSRPDISLWAHSKSTAAIAFCLDRELRYRFKADTTGMKKELEGILTKLKNKSSIQKGDGELFCLVKGDASGIQDFVFDTSMDGALKALKGKSFYIAFLLDTIARFILKEENMPICNLIYNGGGHFYLLMPKSFEEKLPYYQSVIDNAMFKAHKGHLSVLLESCSIDLLSFMGNIGEKFDEVAKKIQIRKSKKFDDIIKKEQMRFFKPYDDFENKCPHCGSEIYTNNAGEEVCSFCQGFMELGNNLMKSLFIIDSWQREANSGKLDSINKILAKFGREIEFSSHPEDISNTIVIDMVKIQELEMENSLSKKGAFDAEYYEALDISTHAPIDTNGDIKLLEDIVKESKGLKTWGIVRGDVDNLGRIFKDGLKDKNSLSRVMTLSQEFSLFFGYYFNKLTKEQYSNSIVIYAGGDDFCVLGPWSDMPVLASVIYKNFRNYVCQNKDITLSMGFEIAPDRKYPIYRVAMVCGEQLDEAKKFEREDGKKKDCFAFGGNFVGWEDFEDLKNVKEKIVSLVSDEGVSKALINAIYSVDKLDKLAKKYKDELFKSWRFVYYIAKLKDRYKSLKNELDGILSAIIKKETNSLYKYAYLAARWAELEMRG